MWVQLYVVLDHWAKFFRRIGAPQRQVRRVSLDHLLTAWMHDAPNRPFVV
jgi:hypothetical protein